MVYKVHDAADFSPKYWHISNEIYSHMLPVASCNYHWFDQATTFPAHELTHAHILQPLV